MSQPGGWLTRDIAPVLRCKVTNLGTAADVLAATYAKECFQQRRVTCGVETPLVLVAST
jgi:hypothetical protein